MNESAFNLLPWLGRAAQPRAAGSGAFAPWTVALWLVGLTLVGAALRLYQLDGPSFWHDELMTIRDVADPSRKHLTRQFGFLPTAIGLRLAGVDVDTLQANQPGTWQAAGVDAWSARIGSCLVGIAAIPILGWASRRILSPRGAVMLALLLALGVWHIYWSQTARFYILQFLFASLAVIAWYDATQRGSRRMLILAAVAFALAFWAHWMALLIGVVLVIDAVLTTLRGESVRLGRAGWAVIALAVGGAAAVAAYVIINNPQSIRFFMHTDPQSPATLVLGTVYLVGVPVAAAAVIGAWLMVRESPRLALLLALTAVLPAAALAVLALADVYVHLRYGFVCYFGWLALAAYGLDRLAGAIEPRLGRVAAYAPLFIVAAAMMLSNAVYHQSGGGFHPRWREAFAYVERHRAEGEPVYVTSPEGFLARYYLQDDTQQQRFPRGREELEAAAGRAWLVAHTETATFGRQQRWLHDAADLRAHFALRLAQPYSGISVYLYEGVSPRRSSE